eukprot:COSAG03_NODE_1016_length_5016_cov_18.038641_3_plen_215_part_00
MPSWARYLWAPGGAMRAVRTVSGAPRVSAAAERCAARCGQRRGPHGGARRIFPLFTRRSVAFRIRFRSPAARTALRPRPGRPWAAQGSTIWMSRADRRPQPAPEPIRPRPAAPSPIFAAARALIRSERGGGRLEDGGPINVHRHRLASHRPDAIPRCGRCRSCCWLGAALEQACHPEQSRSEAHSVMRLHSSTEHRTTQPDRRSADPEMTRRRL